MNIPALFFLNIISISVCYDDAACIRIHGTDAASRCNYNLTKSAFLPNQICDIPSALKTGTMVDDTDSLREILTGTLNENTSPGSGEL